MLVKEIYAILSQNDDFDTYQTQYKDKKHREDYGTSFDAFLKNKDYVYVRVNGGKFKVKSIKEEFGKIVFVYEFNQVEFLAEDIETIEFI